MHFLHVFSLIKIVNNNTISVKIIQIEKVIQSHIASEERIKLTSMAEIIKADLLENVHVKVMKFGRTHHYITY